MILMPQILDLSANMCHKNLMNKNNNVFNTHQIFPNKNGCIIFCIQSALSHFGESKLKICLWEMKLKA